MDAHDPDRKKQFSWDDHFFGSVTVGERGQIVIPAEARKRFQIEPGDKLLMMSTPDQNGLMLRRLDSLREFMNAFQEGLTRVEQDMASVGNGAPPTGDSTHTTNRHSTEEEEKPR